MWLPCKWNVAVSYTIIIAVIVTTQMFRMWPEAYPNHCNFIEIQLAWHCSIYYPVSPVERVLICCAGGSEFKLQPDHELRSLKHWWDHASCDLNPFPVQMVMSLGSNNKPLALSPSSLHISWKGMLKNFDTVCIKMKRVGDVGPSGMVYLTYAVIGLGGWGEIKHGLK